MRSLTEYVNESAKESKLQAVIDILAENGIKYGTDFKMNKLKNGFIVTMPNTGEAIADALAGTEYAVTIDDKNIIVEGMMVNEMLRPVLLAILGKTIPQAHDFSDQIALKQLNQKLLHNPQLFAGYTTDAEVCSEETVCQKAPEQFDGPVDNMGVPYSGTNIVNVSTSNSSSADQVWQPNYNNPCYDVQAVCESVKVLRSYTEKEGFVLESLSNIEPFKSAIETIRTALEQQMVNEERNFPSKYDIDDNVIFVPMYWQSEKYGIEMNGREGQIKAVRFTEMKVLYDVYDKYLGKLFTNVDSAKVFDNFEDAAEFVEDVNESKDKEYIKEVKAYKFFVIDQAEKRAISGWEFQSDAKEALSDYDGDKNFKVVKEADLEKLGIENPKERWINESKDQLPGGKADKLSVEEIAKKHNVSVQQIVDQLLMGQKVELEHTNDFQLAKEIAMDHLTEMPDYYTKLAEMESVNESATEDNKSQFCDMLIFDSTGKLLLLKRKDDAKFMPGKWCLPGGKAGFSEAPDVAAFRESLEESGLALSANSHKFLFKYSNPNGSVSNYYAAVIDEAEPKAKLSEHSEYAWVDPSVLKRYDLMLDLSERIPFMYTQLMKNEPVTFVNESFDDIIDLMVAIKRSKRASWKLWLNALSGFGMAKDQMITFVNKCGYAPGHSTTLVEKYLENDVEGLADAALVLESAFVNEAKIEAVEKHIKAIGKKTTPYDIASYIDDNYSAITGLKDSDKYEEMSWPQQIVDLCQHFGIDPDDDAFQNAWQMITESSEITNDADFKKYAEDILKEAHKEDYDQSIADKTISDLISKYSGDYGAMIGALTSGLGD